MTELADVLRAAYTEQNLDADITETTHRVEVRRHWQTRTKGPIPANGPERLVQASYKLSFVIGEPTQTTLDGEIDRASYRALALVDEQTELFISESLWRSGYRHAAMSVQTELDHLTTGRGPRYTRIEHR